MQPSTDTALASRAANELTEAVTTLLETLKGDAGALDINSCFESLSAYAWSGVAPDDPNWIEERLHEISVAVELLRGNLISPAGDSLVSDDVVEFIHRLANAAHARHAIDEGQQVSTEWLAALARVSERTIRAATNSKNPNAIPITKEGHWTFIEAAHALEWLAKRKDFVPTRAADNRPRAAVLQRELRAGSAWRMWRESRGESVEDLARQLGWSPEDAASYSDVESGSPGEAFIALPPAFWRDLAAHFESEEPEAVAALTYRALAAAYVDWRLAGDFAS